MRLRLVSLAIVIVAVVLAVMAWQRNTAQAPIAPAAPEAANQPPAPGEMPGGAPSGMPGGPPTPEIAPPTATDPGIAWQVPSRWVTQIASGMRLATYVVPAPAQGGEPGECAVYYFGPGQGGGVDANIERWIGEFQNPGKPERSGKDVRGLKVSEVNVTGTYAAHAMSPGEAPGVKRGWTLRGAIVEGPSGSVFFKLTGPGATITAASKEFDGLIASMKKKA